MAQLELKIGDKTYNKAWVDNISSTSQISSDPASVNYGVIPSTGNATMRDIMYCLFLTHQQKSQSTAIKSKNILRVIVIIIL